MAMFNSYVSLPEGSDIRYVTIWGYPLILTMFAPSTNIDPAMSIMSRAVSGMVKSHCLILQRFSSGKHRKNDGKNTQE